MVTEAMQRATSKYHKKHKRVLVLLDYEKDADIVEFLEGKNVTKTIKECLRDKAKQPSQTDM